MTMNIDEAHLKTGTSVGGGGVHVSSPQGTEVITVVVGPDTLRICNIDEALIVLELMGRTVARARRFARESEEG